MSKPLWERQAVIDDTLEANHVYLTFDQFIKYFDRTDIWLGSGAILLTNWSWKPSYLTAVEKKIGYVLDFFEGVKEYDPFGGYTEGYKITEAEMGDDKQCHLYYHERDFLILHFASLWNSHDRVYKIYVTHEDMDKVRKFVENERKTANQYLSPDF